MKISVLSSLAIAFAAGVCSLASLAQKPEPLTTRPNLAIVATPSGSARFGPNLNSINDGVAPVNTGNLRFGGGNRPPQPRTNMWVQYEWKQIRSLPGMQASQREGRRSNVHRMNSLLAKIRSWFKTDKK